MDNVNFLERNEEHVKHFGHLMEGIKHSSNTEKLNQYEQNKMGILLANSVADFCQRKNFRDYNHIKEAQTASTDAATFVKIQLPLIRKIFPAMISREIVSVQPMTQPTWKIFYYDILRDDATSLSSNIHARRDYADNVEYNPSAPTAIKEINMTITSADISARSKKLKEKHTVEAQQDIYAYHGINVASDLSDALSAEIVREWDRTLIQQMFDDATGGAATFDQTVPAGITYSDRKVWMEGIYEAMCDVDNQIFKKRYRKTNFVVAPADIATFIRKMRGFTSSDVSPNEQALLTGGRYFMGTLDSQWKVYVDPFLSSDKMLLGFNNPANWLETSFVFSPYVLSWMSDQFTDPNTQQSVRSILSRAGYKTTIGDCLGTVSVTGS
jgi:hypothetical protein